MVKRDTSSALRFWLGRATGIFLLFCVLALAADLLGFWSTSTPAEKLGALFFIGWCLLLSLSLLRRPRQQQRVELLRMSMDETPLFTKQPALDAPNLALPATLTLQLSRRSCTVFAAYWLIMLGILLIFQASFFQALNLLWIAIAAWLALGALVLGLIALAFYQRIEIAQNALTVQHGWRRRQIPWQEARLFAVLGLDKNNARPYLYELSSARTILRWTHVAPGMGFALQPRDRQAYWKRLDDLGAYIRFRTNLMLRDLR